VPQAPHGPGKEPPQAGTWPADWSQFAADASTASVGNVNGSRFAFRVPASWSCVAIAVSGVDIQYSCTGVTVDGPEGGDLMVRQCPAPCDADIRTGLRQHEDAWGLQWTSGGENVTWAQTASLPGRSSYGLIVVGFWRSVQNGPVDRQVVLRLTAPLERSSALQSVANATYTGIR